MNVGIKYISTPKTANQSGAQNPLKNARPLEYQRFFTRVQTGGDPLSIMANPKTNGTLGGFCSLHGDLHTNKSQHNQSPAFAGNHAENFYSFSNGTVTGSINFPNANNIQVGDVFDGTTVKGYHTTNFGYDWWGTRVEIRDDVYPPEMHVTQLDRNDDVLEAFKFVHQRSGNYAVNIDDDVSAKGAYLARNIF